MPRAVLQFTCCIWHRTRWLFLEEKATQHQRSPSTAIGELLYLSSYPQRVQRRQSAPPRPLGARSVPEQSMRRAGWPPPWLQGWLCREPLAERLSQQKAGPVYGPKKTRG